MPWLLSMNICLFELTKYGLLGRLLIWEDYYYEPLPSPFPPRTVGRSNFPYQDGEGCWFSSESQLGIQEEDRVRVLINKMMVNNSVSIAGEGLVLLIFTYSLFIIILILSAFLVIPIWLKCCFLMLTRIVGRAAFTGNYQWILLNNFTRDAYPPEVWSWWKGK